MNDVFNVYMDELYKLFVKSKPSDFELYMNNNSFVYFQIRLMITILKCDIWTEIKLAFLVSYFNNIDCGNINYVIGPQCLLQPPSLIDVEKIMMNSIEENEEYLRKIIKKNKKNIRNYLMSFYTYGTFNL